MSVHLPPVPIVRIRPARLLAALACGWVLGGLPTTAGADTLRLGGTGAGLGTMKALAEAYRAVEPGFQLFESPSLGTSGGLKAVQEGSLDVAVVARPLTPEEIARGLRAVPYGRTAFVLASARRDVGNLSRKEIAEIYTGTRKAWPDGTPIRVVLRPKNDSDVALLQSMSPEIKAAVERANAREGLRVATTDQDSADAIERLPGGFGSSTLALIRAENRRLVPVAIEGIAPEPPAIEDGRYPWTKTMCLVTLGPPSAVAARFFAFVESPAGRRILAATGHVPPALPRSAP